MTSGAPRTAVPDDIAAGMRASGIALTEQATATPLPGGVSSDIWHVVDGDGQWCAKRALATLRTEAHWDAPIERSANEAAWLRAAHEIAPDAVPTVVGFDRASHVLVLEYLPPAGFRNWKTELLAGAVDPAVARALGTTLGRLHTSMSSDDHREQFDQPDLILALRLEPYLLRTAARHPDLAPRLQALVEQFHAAARTVVHGDVSPKNTLVGDGRVVLLDAECATWGDPAFDVAFCLTHLCAKAVHLPSSADRLRDAAVGFVDAYDSVGALDAPSAGGWLGALLLARVDGASPLEYLDDAARSQIRDRATTMVHTPDDDLRTAVTRWFDTVVATGGPR